MHTSAVLTPVSNAGATITSVPSVSTVATPAVSSGALIISSNPTPKLSKDVNCHFDWYVVVRKTSKAEKSVTLVFKGFGEAVYDQCPVTVEWKGKVLRWLGIGFCRWREWD